MNQVTGPPLVTVPETSSLNTLLADRVARRPGDTLLERRDSPDGPWLPVTAATFAQHVNNIAKGFIALGVEPGDRVGIMSRTRYEWTLLDYALWACAAVSVPVYETSSPEQVLHILSDTAAKAIVVESQAHEDTITALRAQLPSLETVLVIDKGGMRELRTVGASVSDQQLLERSSALAGGDLATVIYTSGSTGLPKGVELTHHNLCHVALNSAAMLPDVLEKEGTRTLLFLPLAHVFARVVQLAVISSNDAVVGHAPDVKNLVADLGSFKPTFLLAVPRVFEKVYNSAAQKAAGSKIKKAMFHWATRASISSSRAEDVGYARPTLKLAHGISDKLVLAKIREAMGGKVEFAISGGAPLGERLGHFYRGLGLTVLEGYGLTETSAPTAVNVPGAVGIGTVGNAMAGTTIKIDDDGEILIRGPHVFRGYRNMPELTAEVLVDGWFHTGDIGSLDDGGRLSITGRKKEIIVTAGGKNVAPAILEDRLRSHPLVSQVVVVGDKRPFIGALLTLDREMLPGWLSSHGLPQMPAEEAARDDYVLGRLQRAVDRANNAVSRAESIRKFRVLDGDFTEANGYLTPSMKVKRSLVLKDFENDINDLYGGPVTDVEEVAKS